MPSQVRLDLLDPVVMILLQFGDRRPTLTLVTNVLALVLTDTAILWRHLCFPFGVLNSTSHTNKAWHVSLLFTSVVARA